MDDHELDPADRLTKDERKALLVAPWIVERHEDFDSTSIKYEIWCHGPYWRICSIDDEDNPHAKICADKIVSDHNAALKTAQRGKP